MTDAWIVIGALTGATFAARLSGVLLGQRIPEEGGWARALNALPGCLIVSLVSVSLFAGGPKEWIAGVAAGGAAMATKSLPLTMVVGIAAIWLLRRLV
jgi:uncharacterized membrane protein